MRLRTNVLVSTLLLSVFGIVMIYSASSYSAEVHFNDSFFYVKKQALYFIGGLASMFLAIKIKLDWLEKGKWIIYIVSMVLLLMLFIPGVGLTSYGATRWISLGFITFQPSEIGKFALVILLAGHMAKYPPNKIKHLIIPVLCGLAMCVAIMLEPNMSITMCVGATLLIMLFAGGMKGKHFAVFGGITATAVPLLIFAEPYRIKRLLAFLDPWATPRGEGYQLIQSYYALGSGGLFGVGLFASRQKHLFLPFAESDFIFSVIGEELGFFGSFAVIAVFATLIISGILIAIRADSRFKSLLASGITAVIAVQTIINLAVVSGSIPPTGLPLPFVSAGGSSLVIFMFASGILMNIGKSAHSAQRTTHNGGF
ncbi:MAG: putative lipid II flippase FtsW [Firmicutes bacterium]|nr:putative lipid II flippase FtsW [Bacillota bacterium]